MYSLRTTTVLATLMACLSSVRAAPFAGPVMRLNVHARDLIPIPEGQWGAYFFPTTDCYEGDSGNETYAFMAGVNGSGCWSSPSFGTELDQPTASVKWQPIEGTEIQLFAEGGCAGEPAITSVQPSCSNFRLGSFKVVRTAPAKL